MNERSEIQVQDVTDSGWYMSADPKLRESIMYLASDQTIDGQIQWFAFFDNGDGGPCESGYIAQAGPLIRVTRSGVSQSDELAVTEYWAFKTRADVAEAKLARIEALLEQRERMNPFSTDWEDSVVEIEDVRAILRGDA